MPGSSDPSHRILEAIRFVGRTSGQVKTLPAFKKSHHSVPDAVNPATSGFLAKLGAPEIAEEGERFFQQARAHLAYKRKDVALDLGAGSATLSAKDFVFEIVYQLSEADPSEYVVVRTLHSLRRADFLAMSESDRLFAGLFSEVVFALTRGAPVEKVIDAVEGLGAVDEGLRVDYPSDYRHCTLTVPTTDAEVRFDGHELSIVFPRMGTPRELWEGFLAVRHAFALTKDQTLADLLSR